MTPRRLLLITGVAAITLGITALTQAGIGLAAQEPTPGDAPAPTTTVFSPTPATSSETATSEATTTSTTQSSPAVPTSPATPTTPSGTPTEPPALPPPTSTTTENTAAPTSSDATTYAPPTTTTAASSHTSHLAATGAGPLPRIAFVGLMTFLAGVLTVLVSRLIRIEEEERILPRRTGRRS